MKTVLAISSQVVRGHVGLGAVVPALQAMGIRVLAMPTVLISNHPGHRYAAGQEIAPALLEEMADALDASGWLEEVDAIISGYLPTAEHVAVVRRMVQRLRGIRESVYLCDPVIGDSSKGVYIALEAAEAIRDNLLPIADIVTPNAFELGWLTEGEGCDVPSVRQLAEGLSGAPVVAVTSVAMEREIGNLLVDRGDAWVAKTEVFSEVPRGTGDLFAALMLGHMLAGCRPDEAVGRATAGVRSVIGASIGADEMRLTETIGEAVKARLAAQRIQ
ncbi:MAG: hypothetical protein RLZ98_1251 [Pseudomonadota bacterium]|jgi:pyridoxine kinase